MESASALLHLQNKASQLEARLNILIEWIFHKFADDPFFPVELVSAPNSSNFTTNFHHETHTETSSTLTGPNEESRTETSSNQQTDQRKQIISSRMAFKEIPLDSIKDEVCDESEMIRVVDMNSILNPSEVQLPLLRSRTRQAYLCTTCNRKFRSSAVLDIHKMSHCYVRITSLDSVTTQVLQPEDRADSDMDAESCHSNYSDVDYDLQHVENDTELLHNSTSKKLHKFSLRKTSKYRVNAKAKRNVGDFVCCVCQKKYSKERYLKQHLKLYHRAVYYAGPTKVRRVRQSKKKYSCNICQQQFTNRTLLKQHSRKFHPEELKAEKAIKGKKCTICKDGEHYATTTDLEKHKAEVHAIPDADDVRRTVKYKCEECNSTFVSRTGFVQHNNAVHLKIRPFICAVCGKAFAKRHDLSCHEDLHSEVKKYTCTHCSKSFQQRQGLEIHVKRHFKSKNQVQCFQCGQFFVSPECLKKHRLEVHEGVRAHACSKCDKRFKKKTHLNYHEKTHDNPNGRKRGLNKEREVLPKREPNIKLLVLQTTEYNFPAEASSTEEVLVDQSSISLPRDTTT